MCVTALTKLQHVLVSLVYIGDELLEEGVGKTLLYRRGVQLLLLYTPAQRNHVWENTMDTHTHTHTRTDTHHIPYLDTLYPLICRNLRISCAFSLSLDFSLAVSVS